MCIASCRVADYRLTASAGSPVGTASFFRSACSRACFAACSCKVSKPCTTADELQFFADLSKLKHANAWRAYLAPLRKSQWVVYAKKPFAGPQQVLAYLARYTHRVAISNSRLLDLDATHVSFRWKDYRENGHRSKVMRLDVGEFMRRFLLHVLPTGFHRIRHYGLFANGHRADKLELCRRALNVPSPRTAHANSDNTGATSSDHEPPPCPCCGGRMIVIETFDGPLSPPYHVRKLDGL